jgi:hypothetical protein
VIHRIRHGMRGGALVAFAVVTLALLPAVRAMGLPLDDEGKGTECFIDKDDTISPGLSVTPSSGTFATAAEGVIECHGPVNGHKPTGDGTYSEVGRYGTKDPDTCQRGGEGDARFVITIPTDGGNQRFAAPFTFTYGEPSTRGGVVAGRFEGDGFHGTFDLTPKEGDCVTKPVTRVHEVQEMRIEDSFFARA